MPPRTKKHRVTAELPTSAPVRRVRDVRHNTDLSTLLPTDANEFGDEMMDMLSRIETGYWPAINVQYGWYQLVTQLNRDLRSVWENYRIKEIKQSHGELYFTFSTNECDDKTSRELVSYVRTAIARSRMLCEVCGKLGDSVLVGSDKHVFCDAHVAR